MLEKNQKRFVLTIGSNREATEQDLVDMALWLENTGNATPNGFKFHIFIKDEFIKSEEVEAC